MSPGDEIRWLNKRRKAGLPLSAYQRWVLGGCRGKKPKCGAKGGSKKELRTAFCPGTKLTAKHYEEIQQLIRANAELKADLARIKRAYAKVQKIDNLVGDLLDEMSRLVE